MRLAIATPQVRQILKLKGRDRVAFLKRFGDRIYKSVGCCRSAARVHVDGKARV